MSEIQIILLSLLQGVTEFLPVSSSGHLILFSKFTTFPDQGQAFDVALHLGSIVAVIIYFAPTLWKILKDLWKSKFLPDFKWEGNQLFYLLLIATLPILVCGAGLKFFGTEWLRNTRLIGWNILLYGLFLWIADKFFPSGKKVKDLKLNDAFCIGLAQCFALLPGTSRSGATITMCRCLGIERCEAAKFAMLMSIPAILAAGILAGYGLWQEGNMQQLSQALNAVGYSFMFSLLAIYVLMMWLKRWSFLPFVIYRVILGTILLLDGYGIYDIKVLVGQ
ncbi:MAG: undecaprenyl-diphosphate phosphatase [Alphaproteobacteria bacterium]|nr:undecaprenyl-diphosphate phosphatase [Alphaproteobacteria bacterium]